MKHFKHDDIRDLQAIIEELATLEKRIDSVKLQIDLAHGSSRRPYEGAKRNQRNDRKDKTMNTQEMIAVMQAYVRGEAIEVSDKGANDWSEIKYPLWDWNSFEYRIKPKAVETLWYWEFNMSDGWHISQTRMTRAQAQAFVGESVEIAPLYALGFRVKDEK